jgi:hypothetical protein
MEKTATFEVQPTHSPKHVVQPTYDRTFRVAVSTPTKL